MPPPQKKKNADQTQKKKIEQLQNENVPRKRNKKHKPSSTSKES